MGAVEDFSLITLVTVVALGLCGLLWCCTVVVVVFFTLMVTVLELIAALMGVVEDFVATFVEVVLLVGVSFLALLLAVGVLGIRGLAGVLVSFCGEGGPFFLFILFLVTCCLKGDPLTWVTILLSML